MTLLPNKSAFVVFVLAVVELVDCVLVAWRFLLTSADGILPELFGRDPSVFGSTVRGKGCRRRRPHSTRLGSVERVGEPRVTDANGHFPASLSS